MSLPTLAKPNHAHRHLRLTALLTVAAISAQCILGAQGLMISQAYAQRATPPKIEDLTDAQQEALVQQLDRGRILYEEGLFDRALKAFEEAYDIFAHPDVLYRIAECQEKLGRAQEALKNYKEVLRLSPDAPDQDKLKQTIATLERQTSTALIISSTPSGATILINGQEQGKTPAELNLPPDTYEIKLTLKGYAAQTKTAKLTAGQRTQLATTLIASAVSQDPIKPEPRPIPQEKSRATPLFWAFGGLTVASGVAATALWVLYSGASSDVENYNIQKKDIPRPTDYNERVDARNSYGTAALLTTGLTLALGGATAIIWSLQKPSEGLPSQHVGINPWVSPEGAGVNLGLNF